MAIFIHTPSAEEMETLLEQSTPTDTLAVVGETLTAITKSLFAAFPIQHQQQVYVTSSLLALSVDCFWSPTHFTKYRAFIQHHQSLGGVEGDFTEQTEQMIRHIQAIADQHFPVLRDAWIARLKERLQGQLSSRQLTMVSDLIAQLRDLLEQAEKTKTREELRPIWEKALRADQEAGFLMQAPAANELPQ